MTFRYQINEPSIDRTWAGENLQGGNVTIYNVALIEVLL